MVVLCQIFPYQCCLVGFDAFATVGISFHRKVQSLAVARTGAAAAPSVARLRGGSVGSSAAGTIVFLWKTLLDSAIATMPVLGQIYTVVFQDKKVNEIK